MTKHQREIAGIEAYWRQKMSQVERQHERLVELYDDQQTIIERLLRYNAWIAKKANQQPAKVYENSDVQ